MSLILLIYQLIENTFSLAALIICGYAALRLYKRHKKTGNKTVGYFSGFFLCKFVAFALIIVAMFGFLFLKMGRVANIIFFIGIIN